MKNDLGARLHCWLNFCLMQPLNSYVIQDYVAHGVNAFVSAVAKNPELLYIYIKVLLAITCSCVTFIVSRTVFSARCKSLSC